MPEESYADKLKKLLFAPGPGTIAARANPKSDKNSADNRKIRALRDSFRGLKKSDKKSK